MQTKTKSSAVRPFLSFHPARRGSAGPLTAGMDPGGLAALCFCWLNAAGKVIRRGRVANDRPALGCPQDGWRGAR
jgi:hypothetical protein